MADGNRRSCLTVILTSVLSGVMLFALFCAIAGISTVLDQQTGSRALPEITEWAINFRPKELASIVSVTVGLTATLLFLGLRVTTRLSSFLAGALSFWLLVGSYLFFFVLAVTISQIHIDGCLYSGPPPSSTSHITGQSIDSRIWLGAALVYSIGLLAYGVMGTRRQKEARNSVQHSEPGSAPLSDKAS